MSTFVCLTEEPSAKYMLEKIIPRILPNTPDIKFIVFEGKQDLEKQLVLKLKHWLTPDTKFLIIRDQDSGDCLKIKQNLLLKIKEAGKLDVSLVRIACHELESFYLGDLQAVEQGLKMSGVSRKQRQSKYRIPDNLGNASEELEKITKYKYQKIAGSKAIAPFLKLDGTNKSRSFNVLVDGIRKLMQDN